MEMIFFFLKSSTLFDVNKSIWMFSLGDGLIKFKEAYDEIDISHSGMGRWKHHRVRVFSLLRSSSK